MRKKGMQAAGWTSAQCGFDLYTTMLTAAVLTCSSHQASYAHFWIYLQDFFPVILCKKKKIKNLLLKYYYYYIRKEM